MLYLQLGPIQIFIYSLNFVVDVNDFTFVRSLFHTLGPRALGPFIAVFLRGFFSSENILHI